MPTTLLMGRVLVICVLIAALGASGAAIYTHIQHEGFWTSVHRLGFRQSGKQVAEDELLSAGTQLQADHQAYGTYRRSNLSHFECLAFGFATDTSYCIHVVKAGKWFHLAGPEGIPQDGACS